MASDSDDSGDKEYSARRPQFGRRTKRKRTSYKESEHTQSPEPDPLFAPLLDALLEQSNLPQLEDSARSFEEVIDQLLPELKEVEDLVRTELADCEESGGLVRPLSRENVRSLLENTSGGSSYVATIVARKLKVQPGTFRRQLLSPAVVHPHSGSVTPLSTARHTSSANPQVIDALYAIQNTPYERSFLSRLQGSMPSHTPALIAIDWETHSPWMDLMSDIREHFALAHPEREQSVETVAPIEYASLRPCHLDQVHDLLERTFWEGVNVSDALDYSPGQCTIIATYKQLVVGAAFLSSPQETYITYLAVRAGWENAQIATTMLYHLITLNPNKDITLHVSINNPAMLLYNRFGFKAEEFVVGFYEDYLDPQSRASKNAFRLRLRR